MGKLYMIKMLYNILRSKIKTHILALNSMILSSKSMRKPAHAFSIVDMKFNLIHNGSCRFFPRLFLYEGMSKKFQLTFKFKFPRLTK